MTLWAEVPVGGAYLVLRDTYDPDWTVTVDGHPAPLLRADGLFRAVHLADGTHTVRMVYRPRPFLVGTAISLLSTLLLLVVCVGNRRRPRGRCETGDREIDAQFRRSS